ncbi:hypothetical protein [Edaphovirga cremea]|uniref:hypothetical protein n=1 Tax=Edaphovirga cremea TaxID=2267246 RepID=UPI003988AC96
MSFQLRNAGLYRQWTEQEDNMLIAMAGKFSPAEIGEAINRSKRAVHCRAQYLDAPLKYYARQKPIVIACHQLRKKGKTIVAIAQALGIPRGTVTTYLTYKVIS